MATFHIFFTIVMLIIFTGIFFWAYSKRRKQDFDAAARLPFADEPVFGTDKTSSESDVASAQDNNGGKS